MAWDPERDGADESLSALRVQRRRLPRRSSESFEDGETRANAEAATRGEQHKALNAKED